uniref:FAD-dependent oxidoreductase n=1 Tax=uncultured Rhizobium sp. TaxID=155567 RepID=UPI00260B31AB|nr:FAD-dependent oxidoreductase [uncultured Rhizobium sp.]
MKMNYDVIVVGAGPVGLWLACELKLAGVDVAVIERRRERTAQSRALTIHGRSLEVFALRGIADRFLSKGKPIPTGHYAALDTRLNFSTFDTRFPYTLFIPQAVTEARLEERALELGVTVLRGITVTGIRDDGSRVHISTDGGEFSGSYVVGADGARSVVREHAGISYEGAEARNSLMLADVVLALPPAKPVVSATNKHGSVMIAPLGDGKHHRIVLVDPQRTHVPRTEPVTLQEVAGPTARIVGEDYQPREPIWLSRFADETRLAGTYRKGRILLAGDAAHIHAPMGGQGMNVGLQDALNLGWKLAAVVKGEAPDKLLDTYDEERRPIGQILYTNTLAQVGLVTRFDPATLALRETLNDLLKIPAVNHRLAGELSGFDVAYGADAKAALTAGQLAAGVRVPDIELVGRDGGPMSLYSLLVEGRWLHISFKPGASVSGPEWLRSSSVQSMAVAPSGHAALRGVRALLVRPDGYVAAVDQE